VNTGLHSRNVAAAARAKDPPFDSSAAHPLDGTPNAPVKLRFRFLSRIVIGRFVYDEPKKPAQRASLRLWLAVLLSIVALWFLDGLLKPTRRPGNFVRK
jgi:hypothetical protein